MIVTSVNEMRATDRHVKGPGWSSTRLIVKADNVGYSVHDTHVDEGAELHLHYTNHIETNYCISGSGEVVDVATGAIYPLGPGSVYALNDHDEHIVRAGKGGLHLVCVFNPALVGNETHRADGSYAVSERVDHVVINVGQNLDQARAQYARLGFQLTTRGHHSLGSSNHLAVFGSDYFELLGVEPQNVAKFADGWNHPAGLSGLVFKTSDAATLWQQLTARQVPLEGAGPADFFRPVELHDNRTRDARFRTVRIAADRIPNGRVFFCEHLTPELVWRPEWQEHANGVTGILDYVYVAKDPAASAAILDQAFGPGVMSSVEHGLRLQAGEVSVFYLRPEGVAARFGVDAGTMPAQGERAVALTLRTNSLQRARDALRSGGIQNVREIDGRIVVPADQAAGVILAFEAR